MKKTVIYLMFLWVVLLSPSIVNAKSNPYKQYNNLFGGNTTNCTWQAWNEAKKRAGVELPGWGNADTWYSRAKNAGYSVGTKPKSNSIFVEKWSNYGHVTYVERVVGNTLYVWDVGGGCIDTEDTNYKKCMENSVSEETDRLCGEKAPIIACEKFYDSESSSNIGFIYLDSKPSTTKKTTTSTTSTTTKTTSTKTTITTLTSQTTTTATVETTIISSDTTTLSTSTYKQEVKTTTSIKDSKNMKKDDNKYIIYLTIATSILVVIVLIVRIYKKN